MTFVAVYALAVAPLIAGQWAFSLVTGRVPETRTEPIALGFHLAAEAITAVMLLVGGVGLLAHRSWGGAICLVALGMLLYTIIVSPGYFAQRGTWSPVGMFAALFGLAVVCLVVLLRAQ